MLIRLIYFEDKEVSEEARKQGSEEASMRGSEEARKQVLIESVNK